MGVNFKMYLPAHNLKLSVSPWYKTVSIATTSAVKTYVCSE